MTIIKNLQNIGFPILDFHSKLKENVFLNTADAKAKGVEAIGNFLLTPARYLLNGKKITKIVSENTDCEYTHENKHRPHVIRMLQNSAAIILLIPGLILGSAFKGLAYLSKNIREKHREIKRCLYSTENIDKKVTAIHEQYKKAGIKQLITDTDHFSNPKPTPRPSADDKTLPKEIQQAMSDHKIEAERLGEMGKILTDAGIPWHVDFGTLLGTYRHNGFIPWDEDMDIGIPEEYFRCVKRLLIEKLPKDKFDVWDFSPSSRPDSILKVRVKETNMLIDVYTYLREEVDGEQKMKYEFSMAKEWWIPHAIKRREPTTTHPLSEIFPLRKAQFDGHEVLVPNKLEDHLIEQYSRSYDSKQKSRDDRIADLAPNKEWNEDQKAYVNVQGHAYNK